MKKFFFALDTVLNYKEQILEHLQEEQVQIIAEALQCEKGIQKLKEEQRQSILVYEDKKKKGMGINELQAFDRFLTSQTKKIEREKLRLQEIRVREEKKRAEVVEAKKETSSITKLKEKKEDQYNKDVQKQEELFIEEFVFNKNASSKVRNTV